MNCCLIAINTFRRSVESTGNTVDTYCHMKVLIGSFMQETKRVIFFVFKLQWRIHSVAYGARIPLRIKIFSISCSFSETLVKII